MTLLATYAGFPRASVAMEALRAELGRPPAPPSRGECAQPPAG